MNLKSDQSGTRLRNDGGGERKRQIGISDLVLTGMFAAVIAVSAQIQIPFPFGVPLTLQTFAVALCSMVLGSKKGAAAVLIYILIGLFGMPVFANFRGGPAVLFGKSGGFLFGFLFMSVLYGIRQNNKIVRGLLLAGGLLICHFLGVLQFSFLTKIDVLQSALVVSVPFLIKDACSVAAACAISAIMKRSLKTAGI